LQVYQRHWAWSIIAPIYKDIYAARTKVLAYDIFNEKKPWCPNRKWSALYLEQDDNPHRGAYLKSTGALINKGGDTGIFYCDYMNKINSSYKIQSRGIVVTNMNIYKHDPKNFKIANKPISIAEITDITVNRGDDQWVIVHTSSKQQDLLLEMANNSEQGEKLSEFITVLVQRFKFLTGNDLAVKFEDKSSFRCKADKEISIAFNLDMNKTTNVAKVEKSKTGLVLLSPRVNSLSNSGKQEKK